MGMERNGVEWIGVDWSGVEWDGLDFIRQIPPLMFKILMVEGLSQTLDLKMNSVDFLCFQNFESKDLGSWFPSLEFSRTRKTRED